jgi:glycosyltransferase involved in cell wall biosynthesis
VITSPISYLTGKEAASKSEKVENWTVPGQSQKQSQGEVRIIRSYVYPALHRSFVHRVINFFSFMFSSFLAGWCVPGVDLVWGTSPPIFQGVTAWGLARLKGVPFLFEVRDLWPAFAVQVGVLQQPALIRASEWLERLLYRHADCVMVNSPGFIDHVSQRGAKQVKLVPNGSDSSMFNPAISGEEFRCKHGVVAKFVVLYAGAHGISNDLGVLLEAAKQLGDLPEIVFIFLGDGKEKPALVRRAKEMGLTNVIFLPPVAKSEMPYAVAAADACVAILKPIPLYKTVYPNKVFDYMAAGKPVILAIEGVIREVIDTAQAGLAVSPGDSHSMAQAVRELAGRPEDARRMGLSGRAYVEKHFDRAILADMLEQVLLDTVAHFRSSGRGSVR